MKSALKRPTPDQIAAEIRGLKEAKKQLNRPTPAIDAQLVVLERGWTFEDLYNEDRIDQWEEGSVREAAIEKAKWLSGII